MKEYIRNPVYLHLNYLYKRIRYLHFFKDNKKCCREGFELIVTQCHMLILNIYSKILKK